jgi:hypothetical protein
MTMKPQTNVAISASVRRCRDRGIVSAARRGLSARDNFFDRPL